MQETIEGIVEENHLFFRVRIAANDILGPYFGLIFTHLFVHYVYIYRNIWDSYCLGQMGHIPLRHQACSVYSFRSSKTAEDNTDAFEKVCLLLCICLSDAVMYEILPSCCLQLGHFYLIVLITNGICIFNIGLV